MPIVIPPPPPPIVANNPRAVAGVVQSLAIRRAKPQDRNAIHGVRCTSRVTSVYACIVRGGKPGNREALVRVRRSGRYVVFWTPAPVENQAGRDCVCN